MAVGQHQNAETEMQARSYRCQISQRRHGFQDEVGCRQRKPAVAAIGVGRTQFRGDGDMVTEKHAVVAQMLGALGDAGQRFDVRQRPDVGENNAVFHTQNLRL